MNKREELKQRTKKFTLNILDFVDTLPNNAKGWVISKQIIRSGSSVGANYRAVCRAKSDRDFANKLDIVIEEADETLFWLEIIDEAKLSLNSEMLLHLLKEANELTAIFVSSVKTVRNRMNKI